MSFGTNQASPPGCVPCGNSTASASSQDSSSDKDHWVEITLVHEDNGEPIASEEYLIVLPDGTELRGFTNAQGKFKAKGLDSSGSAKISFPKIPW